MKLRDLVNSCQNQWKGLLDVNEDFTVKINFDVNGGQYLLKSHYMYDDKYVMDFRNRDVLSWEMINLNCIEVLVSGYYYGD